MAQDKTRALSFKEFVTESLVGDRFALLTMGMGPNLVVLEARVNWSALDWDSRNNLGGRGPAFINYKFYPQFPKGEGIERWDEWKDDVPGLMAAYGKEGDTELVDRWLLDTAEEWDADVLHLVLDDTWIAVETGEILPSPKSRLEESTSRDYKLLKSMGLATPDGLDVDAIEPEAKDRDRADGVYRSSWDSRRGKAAKMARLITDPVKMVRRAKAMAERFDPRGEVCREFRDAMLTMGFSREQLDQVFR